MTMDRTSGIPKGEYYKGYVILKWNNDVYEVWGPIHWVTSHRRSRDLLDTFKTRIEAVHFINEELIEHPRRDREQRKVVGIEKQPLIERVLAPADFIFTPLDLKVPIEAGGKEFIYNATQGRVYLKRGARRYFIAYAESTKEAHNKIDKYLKGAVQ